jgi:hypothetical protein
LHIRCLSLLVVSLSAQVGGNAASTSAAQCLGFLSDGASNVSQHHLVELSVHSFHIGDDGARALAAGFAAGCFHAVQSLDLSHTGLTPHGCALMADAIEKHPMPDVRELLFTGNQIGDQGVSVC